MDTSVKPQRSRLLANIAWNYAAGFTSVFGLLLLYPLAVSIAGAESYGLWVLAFSAIQLFSMSDFGLGNAIVRLLAAIPNDAVHRQERRRFVTVAVGIFVVLAALLTLVFAVAFPLYLQWGLKLEQTTHVGLLVPLAALTLFACVMGRAMNSILWAEDRPDIERKASLVSIVARVVGYLLVMQLDGGLAGVMIVEAVTLMIPPVVCALAVFRRYGAPAIDPATCLDTTRQLLGLSGVLFVGTFSLLTAFHLPLYVIGSAHGLAAVTAFGGIMRVYLSARLLLSWTANPFIHRISTAERGALPAVMHRCLALGLLLAVMIGAPIAFLADDIVSVWMGDGFIFAGAAFAALALGILADAMIQPSSLVVNLRGNPWLVSCGNLLLLCLSTPLVIWAADTGDLLLTTLAMVVLPLLAGPLYVHWALRVANAGRARPTPLVLLIPMAAVAGCVASSLLGSGWPPLIAAAFAQTGLLAGVVLKARRWFFASPTATEQPEEGALEAASLKGP